MPEHLLHQDHPDMLKSICVHDAPIYGLSPGEQTNDRSTTANYEIHAQPLTQNPTEPKGYYDRIIVIGGWDYIYHMTYKFFGLLLVTGGTAAPTWLLLVPLFYTLDLWGLAA
ncbi:MAG: hypothetical protein NXY57DRAFT_968328 [Lentinula lateritia]|nr:MAG: hypothetical protein NXY57DRAFT_968328 [Lentinula lateritia]